MQFTKKRRALSGVIVTLIILVASVVLGTGVVLYGTSLFQSKAQNANIAIQGLRMWVNQTQAAGVSWGAVGIRNSGDVIVSFDTITVRGQTIPFSNWFVDTDPLRVTQANFQSQYNLTTVSPVNGIIDGCYASPAGSCAAALLNPSSCNAARAAYDTLPIAGQYILQSFGNGKPVLCLNSVSGPTSLKPGAFAVIYFKIPNGIVTPVDAGSTIDVSLFAGKTGSPQNIPVGTS